MPDLYALMLLVLLKQRLFRSMATNLWERFLWSCVTLHRVFLSVDVEVGVWCVLVAPDVRVKNDKNTKKFNKNPKFYAFVTHTRPIVLFTNSYYQLQNSLSVCVCV